MDVRGQSCILCQSRSRHFFEDVAWHRSYFRCESCDLIFLEPSQRLTLEEERSHYDWHVNNVHDNRYQNFVKPLYDQVLKHAVPDAQGLDFGCGDGPVLAYLLEKNGFQLSCYDPYFRPDREVLQRNYDFVICCEVVEHFFQPRHEFNRMLACLKRPGFLGLMTQIYNDAINFETWYYRRDPTHVCFYTVDCLQWIGETLGFAAVWTDEKQVAVMSYQ